MSSKAQLQPRILPSEAGSPDVLESFLAAIFESSDDALIVKRLDGTILSWNPAAERIYGYSAAEAVGRSITFLAPPERSEEIPEILRRLAAGERVDHFETDRVRKDGRKIRVSLSVSPIHDRSGTIIGASVIARDVTAQRRKEEDLRKQLEQQARRLAASNQRKIDFLAVLAHELRNPLAAIAHAVELAEASNDDAVEDEARGIVKRQSRLVARLVDDLLDVSCLGRGLVELERVRLDLRTVVERAVESVAPQLDARGQRLEIDLPRAPIVVDADAIRLGQVISNLLVNASKYSEEGNPIELAARRAGGWAELVVKDHGQGIDPELLPEIFELFAQGQGVGGRPTPGLGIGLTLVRQLVELHGGQIEARSEGRGKGSEFRVRLRQAEVPEPAEPDRPERAAKQVSTRRLRVLLVDDHQEATMALETLLGLWGHTVRAVFDGASALAAARELDPQLVLLDIGLPDMDGWEVARRLRRDGAAAGAVLVALTGFGQELDRERSREAGFDHHLTKPTRPPELKRYLREWFPEE